MKYRVGFIDDERDIIMKLQRQNNGKKFSVNNSDVEIEIVEIPLHSEIDEVINEINARNLSAIIVDYLLSNTRGDIHFDGVDIVNKMDEERINFPTFILTGYSEDAENCLVDLNKIYKKPDYTREPHSLNKRIVRQIQNYQNRINKAQEKLIDLINRRGELDIYEEKTMLELDDFIEKSISNNTRIPSTLKESKNLKMMQSLIDATESILKEVKKNEQ